MRRVVLIAAMLLAAISAFSDCGTAVQLPELPNPLTPRIQAYADAIVSACSERGISCRLFKFKSETLNLGPNYNNLTLDYMVVKVDDRVGVRPPPLLAQVSRPFPCIGVSRLTKPGVVSQTPSDFEAALLIHGAQHTFSTSFINARAPEPNPGIAPWLASKSIDVWGVDLRYVFVPSTTTDFSFMAGWDFKAMTDDVRLAARIAVRFRHPHTDSSPESPKRTLHLIGNSLGGGLVYSVANAEAAPGVQRPDIGDLISIEGLYQLPETSEFDAARNGLRTAARFYRTPFENGVLQDDNGFHLKAIGEAALSAPDQLSGITWQRPGPPFTYTELTNSQVALKVACAPWWRGFSPHTAACPFSPFFIPTEGSFSPNVLIHGSLADSLPFRPNKVMADFYGIAAFRNDPTGSVDVSDDISQYLKHLGKVGISSYYIGAKGGFGPFGKYTNMLLGTELPPSTEPNWKTADVLSPAENPVNPLNDWGHVEPLIDDASSERDGVNEKIVGWITDHPKKTGWQLP